MTTEPAQGADLNGICPYFTMFPLAFPLRILGSRARRSEWVLDPFCGRGTTNLASRLLGLPSLAVDSNPVAVAITAAKLVSTSAAAVLGEARTILATASQAEVPRGEFWRWAYHPATLGDICRLRQALLEDCASPARLALRGVLLGALHGPIRRLVPSYLSNQCPRTYAPKPGYAARFWQERRLRPAYVGTLGVIERRANRFYAGRPAAGAPAICRLADSREPGALDRVRPRQGFRWVVTSPPYYGMRTYRPDQWLRNWFLGGVDRVDYSNHGQIVHSAPDDFSRDLAAVWRNAAAVCAPQADMVIRFGGICDRKSDPLDLIKASLAGTGWRIRTIVHAGTASAGRRQADSFLRTPSRPMAEHDIWTRLRPSVRRARSPAKPCRVPGVTFA